MRNKYFTFLRRLKEHSHVFFMPWFPTSMQKKNRNRRKAKTRHRKLPSLRRKVRWGEEWENPEKWF